MDLAALVLSCAPLIAPSTANAILVVESGLNPHAVGVVGGALERQPRNKAEALATIESLNAAGWNYSVGLAQINKHNFARLGLTADTALNACENLAAMQTILGECYARAKANSTPQRALRDALSCYYSGNFVTGYQHGYVDKVVAASASRSASSGAATSSSISPNQTGVKQ